MKFLTKCFYSVVVSIGNFLSINSDKIFFISNCVFFFNFLVVFVFFLYTHITVTMIFSSFVKSQNLLL